MKKYLFLISLATLSFVKTHGQMDTIEISSFDSLYSPIIQYSYTGILPELYKGSIPYELYDGANPEQVPLGVDEFKQLLSDLEMANLGNQYQMLDSIIPRFKKTTHEQREVPIVFLHLEYDKLREDTTHCLLNMMRA